MGCPCRPNTSGTFHVVRIFHTRSAGAVGTKRDHGDFDVTHPFERKVILPKGEIGISAASLAVHLVTQNYPSIPFMHK